MIARMPPMQLALAALCGALVLVFAYEIAAPIPRFDVPKSTEFYRPAPITFQDTANAPSAASFADIDAHPIFSASRTPIASHVDTAHGGTSSALPTDVSLIGVIIAGKTRMALLKAANEPFARSVPQGGQIGGWTVMEVDPDRIVLSSGAAKQEILLAANRAADSSGLSVNPGAGTGPNIGPNVAPTPNSTVAPGAGTSVPPMTPPNSPPASSSKPPPDNPPPAPHQ